MAHSHTHSSDLGHGRTGTPLRSRLRRGFKPLGMDARGRDGCPMTWEELVRGFLTNLRPRTRVEPCPRHRMGTLTLYIYRHPAPRPRSQRFNGHRALGQLQGGQNGQNSPTPTVQAVICVPRGPNRSLWRPVWSQPHPLTIQWQCNVARAAEGV